MSSEVPAPSSINSQPLKSLWTRFDHALRETSEQFPAIYQLNEAERSAIESSIKQVEGRYYVLIYLISTVSAIVSFIPILYTLEWYRDHWRTINRFLQDHFLIGTNISSNPYIYLLPSVLALYCLLPLLFRIKAMTSSMGKSRLRILADHPFLLMNPYDSILSSYAIFGGYIIYVPVATMIATKFKSIGWLAPLLLAAWLAIPYFLFSVSLLILLIVLVSSQRIDAIRRSTDFYRLLTNLMNLILSLSKASSASLTMQRRDQIAREITLIADRIQILFRPKQYGLDYLTRSRLKNISERFRQYSYWIYFPQIETIPTLQAKLLDFLNVGLSGNLHHLDDVVPTGTLFPIEPTKDARWSKIVLHASMAIYFLLPLVAAVVATRHWDLQLNGFVQSIAAILYLSWVVIGFFAFSDSLSIESRTLLADVLKLAVGQKFSK